MEDVFYNRRGSVATEILPAAEEEQHDGRLTTQDNSRQHISGFQRYINIDIFKEFSDGSQSSQRELCRTLFRMSHLPRIRSLRFRQYFRNMLRSDSEISEECVRILKTSDVVYHSTKKEIVEDDGDVDSNSALTSTTGVSEEPRSGYIDIANVELEIFSPQEELYVLDDKCSAENSFENVNSVRVLHVNDETESEDADGQLNAVRANTKRHADPVSHGRGVSGRISECSLEDPKKFTYDDETNGYNAHVEVDSLNDNTPEVTDFENNYDIGGSDLDQTPSSTYDADTDIDYDDGEVHYLNDETDKPRNSGSAGSEVNVKSGGCVSDQLLVSVYEDDNECENDDGEVDSTNDHTEERNSFETQSISGGSDLDQTPSLTYDADTEVDSDGEVESLNDQTDEIRNSQSHNMGVYGNRGGNDLDHSQFPTADERSEVEYHDGKGYRRNCRYDNTGGSGSGSWPDNGETNGLHPYPTSKGQSFAGDACKTFPDRSDQSFHYQNVITGQNNIDASVNDWPVSPLDSSQCYASMPEEVDNHNGENAAPGQWCHGEIAAKELVIGTKDEDSSMKMARLSIVSNEMLEVKSSVHVSNREPSDTLIDAPVEFGQHDVDEKLINKYLSTKAGGKYIIRRELLISNESWRITNIDKNRADFIKNIITPSLNELCPSCVTKLSNYRMRPKKTISPQFSLLGKCVCRTCPLMFKIVLMQVSARGGQTLYFLQGTKPIHPHPQSWNCRSKVYKRKIAHEVIRHGASTVYYNEIGEAPLQELKTGEHQVPTLSNLRQMAQRLRNKDRYKMDINNNEDLTAEVLRAVDFENKVLPGYVQAKDAVAGSRILFTEDQFRELARCKDDITLHMDATGSIIRKNKLEKQYLYHAVVFNRGNGTPPLPAIEMISQHNSTTEVINMLTHLRNDYRRVTNKELKVDSIVTDQSWPNITAILTVFQLGNIERYLDVLWESDSSHYKGTKIKLCYAHIMKNVASKAKKYLPAASGKHRFALCVLFSRMADSTTKSELDTHFKILAKVLLSQNFNTECVDEITCTNEHELESLYDSSPEVEEDEREHSSENRTRIRDRCAAGRHFDELSQVMSDSIDDAKSSERNELYSPALLDNLLTNVLPFAPLWSSLHGKRKTNAMVENHHKIVKHDVLKNKVDVATFLYSMYRNVKQRAKEYAVDFAPRQKKGIKPRKSKIMLDNEERWFKKGRRNGNKFLKLVTKLNKEAETVNSPRDTGSQSNEPIGRIGGDRQEGTHFRDVNHAQFAKDISKCEQSASRVREEEAPLQAIRRDKSYKLETKDEKQKIYMACKRMKTSKKLPQATNMISKALIDGEGETASVCTESYFDEICKPNNWSQWLQFPKKEDQTNGQSKTSVKDSERKIKSVTPSAVSLSDMSAASSGQFLFTNSNQKSTEPPTARKTENKVSEQDLNWISVDSIRLTMRNKWNILCPMGWITSDEIDAFLCLINQSNLKWDPHTQMPMCLTVCAPNPLLSPLHKFIQIINTQYSNPTKWSKKYVLGSHWVVLSNAVTNPCSESGTVANIAYFCSLGGIPTPDIKQYLFRKYSQIPEVKEIRIHIHAIQRQLDHSSCGLFAIANATALAENYDPSLIEYDIDQMRSHTAKCLQENVVSSFPTTQLGINFKVVNNQLEGLYGPRIRTVVSLQTGRH